MQGWRVSMEDAHAAVLSLLPDDKKIDTTTLPKTSFFAVYDGHGGSKASIFAGESLHKILATQESFISGNYENALKDCFLSTDRALLQDPDFKTDPSGCTATTALITKDKIFVANAGDSRTVLGVKGVAKPLSFDHKPQSEGEKARICSAGGFVEDGRVNGNLALSRAIGDFGFKTNPSLPPEEQVVTVMPDVMEHEIKQDEDEFLVLACDGIWDCMESQEVIEFVRRGIAEGQELTYICENIMDHCLAPESDMSGIGCDNMTMMIVGLLNGKTKEEWYALIKDRVDKGDGPVAPPEFAKPRAKSSHFSNESGPSNGSRNEDDDDDESHTSTALSLQRLLEQNGIGGPDGSALLKSGLAEMLIKLSGGSIQIRQSDDDEDDSNGAVEEVEEIESEIEVTGDDMPSSNRIEEVAEEDTKVEPTKSESQEKK